MPCRSLLVLLVLLLLGACGESAGEPPPAAPVPAPVPVPATLRVVCLNVWAVPVASKDLDLRFARMLPALDALAPDVVCLQEVFLEPTRRRIVQGLGAGWTCTDGTAGGLLIASRLPVEESTFTPFPVDAELSFTERLARKGFLEVVVATPAGRLRVVTTHLAAEWSEDGARRRQQDHLLQSLAARTGEPLLLAGDLNTAMVTAEGPTAAWEAVRGAGFTHAEPPRRDADGRWVPASVTRSGWPRGTLQRGWTPDHVLVRDGGTAAARVVSFAVGLETPESAVSDHNLLLATIRLTPR